MEEEREKGERGEVQLITTQQMFRLNVLVCLSRHRG